VDRAEEHQRPGRARRRRTGETVRVTEMPVTALVDRSGRVAELHCGLIDRDDMRRKMRYSAVFAAGYLPEDFFVSRQPGWLSNALGTLGYNPAHLGTCIRDKTWRV
jgi:hypothetical protein